MKDLFQQWIVTSNKQIANLSVFMKIYIKQLNFYREHGNLIDSEENTKWNGALLLVN